MLIESDYFLTVRFHIEYHQLEYDSDTETDGDVSWKARLKEFEPHSVYRNRTYPKTGGRLGNCYLLWGNELKHDYFPFVAIVGPDWKMLFLTLSLPVIVLLCYVGYSITLQAFEFWGFIVAIVVCMFSELFFLMTTMSNPGIVFRGMRPSTENNPVQCGMRCGLFLIEIEECHCDRVSLRVHHCYRCNLCHYKVENMDMSEL